MSIYKKIKIKSDCTDYSGIKLQISIKVSYIYKSKVYYQYNYIQYAKAIAEMYRAQDIIFMGSSTFTKPSVPVCPPMTVINENVYILSIQLY